MMSNQIRVKTHGLATLRRASTILAQHSIAKPLELDTLISNKQNEIISLCIKEIKSPTNADNFVYAVCKLARGSYTVLRNIAAEKIKE